MIYNKTLFLITNQYTSEPYSYQSSYWRQRTRWGLVGGVHECGFLKRTDNVVVEQYLPTGRDGKALGPKLRLLDGFLSYLDSDQKKSMAVLLRIETNQLHCGHSGGLHPQWENVGSLLGNMDFGCRPQIMIEDSVWSTPGRPRDETVSWKAKFEELLEAAGVQYESLSVRSIR